MSVLYGTVFISSRLCIVMKLYCGTLSDEIEAAAPSGLSLPRVLELSAQTARAVAELAAVRVVIQDLKPTNLLLNAYGDVVVSYFGLSAQLHTSLSRLMVSDLRGTPNYMSPEQFDPSYFGGIGTPADVWALGCCMHEMLEGKPPWVSTQFMVIARLLCDKKQHPAIPTRAPAEVRAMIKACFAFKPEDRIPADGLRDLLAMAAAKEIATPGLLDGVPFEDAPPVAALCALSQQLMSEPVRASDGHVYERSVIALWLRNHSNSPVDGSPLSRSELLPEHELQSSINSWVDEQTARLADDGGGVASTSSNEAGASGQQPKSTAASRAALTRWLQWAGFPEAAAKTRSMPPLADPQAACSDSTPGIHAPQLGNSAALTKTISEGSLLASVDAWTMDTWMLGYMERYTKT